MGDFNVALVIVAAVVSVLVLLVSVYLLVNYHHPDDANQAYFPKLVVVLGVGGGGVAAAAGTTLLSSNRHGHVGGVRGCRRAPAQRLSSVATVQCRKGVRRNDGLVPGTHTLILLKSPQEASCVPTSRIHSLPYSSMETKDRRLLRSAPNRSGLEVLRLP